MHLAGGARDQPPGAGNAKTLTLPMAPAGADKPAPTQLPMA